MINRIYIGCLLFFCCCIAVSGQKIKEYPGYRISNASGDSTAILFKYENQNIINRYTFYLNSINEDPIYTVEIYYDDSREKIFINRNFETTDSVTVRNDITACMIKDDSVYARKVDLFNPGYRQLLTFPTLPDKEKILLNQIMTKDKSYTYILFPVEYLEEHTQNTAIYWGEFYSRMKQRALIAKDSAQLATKLWEEKKLIRHETDSLLSHIKHREDSLMKLPIIANGNLQFIFAKRMDTLIARQFRKGVDKDCEYDVEYRIISYPGEKKMDIKTNSYTPNDTNNTWLRKQLENVGKETMKLKLEKEKVPVIQINLARTVLRKNHEARCNKNILIDSTAFFTPLLDSLDAIFTALLKKKMEVPTLYYYPYTYISVCQSKKLSFQDGLYTDRTSRPYIGDCYNPDLNDTISRMYRKFARNGDYLMRINNSKIRARNKPQSAEKEFTVTTDKVVYLKKKYTYYTCFGASVGIFAWNGDSKARDFKPEVNRNTNLLYVDLLIVNHYFGGFFGGTFTKYFRSYFEGGAYLAPCNFLYFKLGAAYYQWANRDEGKVEYFNILTGVSLIFPYVQLEGGYNFATRYPYMMVGLNYPLNR